jgi:hypothetical protein
MEVGMSLLTPRIAHGIGVALVGVGTGFSFFGILPIDCTIFD